jgi:hypothetical protein
MIRIIQATEANASKHACFLCHNRSLPASKVVLDRLLTCELSPLRGMAWQIGCGKLNEGKHQHICAILGKLAALFSACELEARRHKYRLGQAAPGGRKGCENFKKRYRSEAS